MKLFIFYRIAFIVSFIILLFGSTVQASPIEYSGFNGEKILLAGFLFALIYTVLAFFMLYRSKAMETGEKLIWVVLFSAGLLFKIHFILLVVGLIFFIIGPKRLKLKA